MIAAQRAAPRCLELTSIEAEGGRNLKNHRREKFPVLLAVVCFVAALAGCRGTVDPIGQAKSSVSALGDGVSPDADLIDRSLMILDPAVVDSPEAQSRLDNPNATGTGLWSFAHLIQSISGSQDPS